MAGFAPEGSQFDARHYDAMITELLSSEAQDFFLEYKDVYESFDATGLQESFLGDIYAYGFENPSAIQQRGTLPFCEGLDGILQQLDYGLVNASKESLNRMLFHPTGCIQKNTTRKADARKQTTLMSLSGHYQVFNKRNHCVDKVKKNCR